MINQWRDFFREMKAGRAPVMAYLAGALFALGFWGIVFPQYLFADDCVEAAYADGREAAFEERGDENLYRVIGTAAPEQIEIRLGILEWAKR